MSGLRDASEKVLSLGANDFLPKPFEEAELIARIRSVAAQPRAA